MSVTVTHLPAVISGTLETPPNGPESFPAVEHAGIGIWFAHHGVDANTAQVDGFLARGERTFDLWFADGDDEDMDSDLAALAVTVWNAGGVVYHPDYFGIVLPGKGWDDTIVGIAFDRMYRLIG